MADIVTRRELEDAKVDAKDLGEAVNEKVIVSPRYGGDFKSLPLLSAEAQSSINGWEAAISLITQEDGVPALAVSDASGKTQQEVNDSFREINLRTITPYTFHADGVGANRPVSDWTVIGSAPYYADLAAIQVDYPHVTSLTDSIDWAAFQKFLDYIKVNKCNAVAFGDFFINKPLNFLRDRQPYTRVINGDITLRTTSAMTHMLRMTGLMTKWVGYINCQAEATGAVDYSLRTVEHGVVLGGFEEGYTSLGISVDEIRVHGVKQLAVFCREWSMFARIGSIRTSACGFGAKYEPTRIYSNWSNRVDTGTDFTQRTSISVTNLPPTLDTDSTVLIVNINDEPYRVTAIDTANNKIEVYPKIDTTLISGQLYYVGGGAFGVDGANSNCVKVDLLSAVSSGIGCYNRSFYDLQITRLVSEANGSGYVHGKVIDQALLTTLISNYYNETDSWLDLISCTNATNVSNIIIASSSGLSENRFKSLAAFRNSDNTINRRYSDVGISNAHIGRENKQWLKLGSNSFELTDTVSLEVCNPKSHIYRKNSWTINLTCSENNNTLYGWDSTSLEIIGTGSNNKPTGDIIFNAPAGWTINGASSLNLKGAVSSIKVTMYAYFATKSILLVSNIPPSAKKTIDPPSLAANSVAVLTTVSLVGATIGSNVNVSFSIPLGVQARVWGEVTTTNTVTVYIQNLTASPVDISSGDLSVKLV